MNNIFFQSQSFCLNYFTAIIAIIVMSIWTRFSMNMLLCLAERVGLIMTDEDLSSPKSTAVKEGISLFRPSNCIQCEHEQNLTLFIPFIPFFRKHKKNCIFNNTYKNQKKTLFTELFFLLTTCIIVFLLLFNNSNYALETLLVYGLSIPLIIFDINFHWVPDRFSFIFLFSGLVLSPLASLHDKVYACVGYASLLTFSFIMSSFIRKKDMASSGDILLIAGAGAWTGINNIFYMSVSLILISILFSLTTTFQNYKNKENVAGIPFAPAIMGATVITILINVLK